MSATPDGCCHGHIWIDRYETHDSPAEWDLCRQLAVERSAHAEAIKEAVEKERERCRQLVLQEIDGALESTGTDALLTYIAKAIREGK